MIWVDLGSVGCIVHIPWHLAEKLFFHFGLYLYGKSYPGLILQGEPTNFHNPDQVRVILPHNSNL